MDSASYGFRTILVSDMLATNTQELQDFHLKELGHQYATPMTFDEVCGLLDAGKL